MMSIRFSQEMVTPHVAQKWLDSNHTGQRLVKSRLVEYLVRIIEENQWNSDLPQPIMIGENETLLDGQHRCHAIVKTGASVLCWVARHVPERAFSDIDTGVARSLADRVQFVPDDLTLNREVSTLLNQWWMIDAKRSGRPNVGEAWKIYNEYETAILWAARARPREKGIGRAQVAVAFAQMFLRDADKAQRLADTVWGGDMKRENGIRLREFLLASVTLRSRGASNRGSAMYIYKTAVYTCKAELADKIVKRLGVASWED